MENNDLKVIYPPMPAEQLSKMFLSKVFNWMFLALAISGSLAYAFSAIPELHDILYSERGFTTTGLIVAFSPIIFVMVISFRFEKLSLPAITGLFITYAALTGASLSSVLMRYTTDSVVSMFAATSLMFGTMAIAGARTNTDLTKFGSLMFMGLIGVVIASVINWFLESSAFGYLISMVGVLVFMGLTAWDVQKLKRIGMGVEYGEEAKGKLAILGALNLYLDFINIFLFMLRLFGGRKS